MRGAMSPLRTGNLTVCMAFCGRRVVRNGFLTVYYRPKLTFYRQNMKTTSSYFILKQALRPPLKYKQPLFLSKLGTLWIYLHNIIQCIRGQGPSGINFLKLLRSSAVLYKWTFYGQLCVLWTPNFNLIPKLAGLPPLFWYKVWIVSLCKFLNFFHPLWVATVSVCCGTKSWAECRNAWTNIWWLSRSVTGGCHQDQKCTIEHLSTLGWEGDSMKEGFSSFWSTNISI